MDECPLPDIVFRVRAGACWNNWTVTAVITHPTVLSPSSFSQSLVSWVMRARPRKYLISAGPAKKQPNFDMCIISLSYKKKQFQQSEVLYLLKYPCRSQHWCFPIFVKKGTGISPHVQYTTHIYHQNQGKNYGQSQKGCSKEQDGRILSTGHPEHTNY